ncbi:MAG TPA: F0F1 ATP synthase subunit A, partial [Acetobacteraceae bacterium]
MAAEGSNSIDALGQFQLHPALGYLGESVNFTQANLMMVIAGLAVLALLYVGMSPRAMVPGRLQAAAEMGYETILNMCVETIGEEGRRYFPFVFTLFFFILFGNLLGVFPLFFTFTSHIMVTLALSLLVFVLVTAVAL